MADTKPKHKVIGIDLGTTMSCMAGVVNGNLSVIVNKDGESLTPSVVWYSDDGSAPVVGSNALMPANGCPSNFVYEAKRMLGKGFHDPDIKRAIEYWPFTVREIKMENGRSNQQATDNIGIFVKEKGVEVQYEPVQVSANVLGYLYDSAKIRLGQYPTYAVITVPAYFHDSSKQRTLQAAKLATAGRVDENNNPLTMETALLSEPTAAAMAYGSIMMANKQMTKTEERILVFDLGGGTYDVSVLDFTFDEEAPLGLVKGTDGDNFLGGADFDNVIIEMAKKKFQEDYPDFDDSGMTEEEKKKADLRLRLEAIKVKVFLSSNLKVKFNISCYRGTKDLSFEITQIGFERAARKIFDKLLEKVRGVLLSCSGIIPAYTPAGMLDRNEIKSNNQNCGDLDAVINRAKASIDKVVMVGGSSRIPKVKAILEEFFGDKADTPVASKKVVSPLNPDEAIAYGAACFANSQRPESGVVNDVNLLLVDTVPLNINIETYGGIATTLIKANSNIPANAEQDFTTAADNQTSVEIVITQGNRKVSSENAPLGKFTLSGIPPAPRGVAQIHVNLSVDRNNILLVTAKEKTTGAESQLTIDNFSNKLSKDDIERMVKQAEEHAKADQAFEAYSAARNTYEAYIYQSLDKIEGTNLADATKQQVKALIEEEESWLKTLSNTTEASVVEARMAEFTKQITALMGGASGAAPSSNPADNPDVEEIN
ncbi:heat shock 70kDa protein 1/2/6/8 [Pancytospora philotis]|nr:heat shock 70kDa protein 1/2/6/8 [Pancytospora philotis]